MADQPTNNQTDEQQTDQAQTDDATGAGDGQNGGDDQQQQPTFSQADLDRIVKERLERAQKQAEAKTQKAREEAEAKALADQEKWKDLAEKHGTKLQTLEADLETRSTELETAAQRIERLGQALTAQLAAQKEGLPEATLELLNRLDPVDQLEYLAKHRGSLTANTNGVPPSPAAADETAVTDEQKKSGKDRMGQQIKNWF